MLSVRIKKSKLLVLICLFAFGAGLFLHNDPVVQIVLFIIQYAIISIYVKFDFINPLFWFLGAFTVYSTAYPILFAMGINVTKGYSPEPLRWNWIAMITFFLFFTAKKSMQKSCERNTKWKNKRIYELFILASGLFVIVSIIMIRRGGFTHKNEIYANGNIVIRLTFSLIYIVHTIYISLMAINDDKNEKNHFWIFFVGLISILLTMFSGERDIIFRFIIITIFCGYLYGRISQKRLFTYMIFLLALLPISGVLKYFFLNAKVSSISIGFNVKSIVNAVLSGEFESASKNLQILATDKDGMLGALGGISYLSDIIRITGITIRSSLVWFNDKYYAGSTVGHGFTIVGEGLVNFGIVGVIFSFMSLSIALSSLYKRLYSNEVYNIIMILIVPVVIYAIRADFANILSPFVKHILIPIAFFGLFIHKRRFILKRSNCFDNSNDFNFLKGEKV